MSKFYVSSRCWAPRFWAASDRPWIDFSQSAEQIPSVGRSPAFGSFEPLCNFLTKNPTLFLKGVLWRTPRWGIKGRLPRCRIAGPSGSCPPAPPLP